MKTQSSSTNFAVSSNYVDARERDRSVIVSTHIFQDSFPALGTHNAIGGSATVHAQQAAILDQEVVMVAPTENPALTLDKVSLPAVGFKFAGSADRNHDEWFERPNREMVADMLDHITNKHDPLYSHMPISGAIGNMVAKSQGNPHVYLGHAWEYLSAQFFPERGLKPLRLLTEYEMVREADVIVTNTRWEADAVAKLYSELPAEAEPRKILTSVNLSADQIKLYSNLILKDSAPLLSYEEIMAKCIANPLGVDLSIFNPESRMQLRNEIRDEFLSANNFPSDAVLLGSVGRIHPQKDPVAAIELFAKVWTQLNKPTNLRLVLAGPFSVDERGAADGYFKEVLDILDGQHSSLKKYVVFPGTVKADEMNSILDIRVDTSRFETFGLSILEAVASGLPTVATWNPVYEELYSGQNIVIEKDLGVLVEKICGLVKSPNQRTMYGDLCAEVGATYSWDNSVEQLKKNVLKAKGFF